MKLKLIIIASLLASCEIVPDEVSASGFTSRYDFLGASSLKEMETKLVMSRV